MLRSVAARGPSGRSPVVSHPSNVVLPLLLLLLFVQSLLLVTPAHGFAFTTKPPSSGNKKPPPGAGSTAPFVKTINQRVVDGTLRMHVRRFAKLPDFQGVGSKIVGMTTFGDGLYVATSTSGAYIYRVDLRTRKVVLWFRLGERVKQETGGDREVNCLNAAHGGLRSVAFPPDFFKTGLFYTSFVETKPGKAAMRTLKYFSWPQPGKKHLADSVVVEWRYDFGKRAVVRGSYRTVIRIALPVFDHPIKQIIFQGSLLLITHGDASVQSGVGGGGLNNDALGKVLRIDPRKPGPWSRFRRLEYSIPASNPYVRSRRYRGEIYAIGFRNPHNICSSIGGKGVMPWQQTVFVVDAGRDNAEEVNILTPGGNYGWPKREGTFVHLERGGTLTGIAALPPWDAKFGFTYPVAQVGHFARNGSVYQGQALAGGCPVENGSKLTGTYWYANFPSNGEMYYSWVGAMKKVRTRGTPAQVQKTALVHRAKVVFYPRNRNKGVLLNNFLEVLKYDGYPKAGRADVRFGRGHRGQMFVSSKTSGTIYIVDNSIPPRKF